MGSLVRLSGFLHNKLGSDVIEIRKGIGLLDQHGNPIVLLGETDNELENKVFVGDRSPHIGKLIGKQFHGFTIGRDVGKTVKTGGGQFMLQIDSTGICCLGRCLRGLLKLWQQWSRE